MSKRTKVPAVERTRTMVELIRESFDAKQHPDFGKAWIVCEEVANHTGWGRVRYADVLALAVWKSLKFKLIGYEVKASKGDLKRELELPAKSEAVAQYCDEWWLVAWDESVLVPGIPADWGILLVEEDDLGVRRLKLHKKARSRHPVTWSKEFIASLVRNAAEQSLSAEMIARISDAVATRARAEGIRKGREQEVEKCAADLLPLAKLLFPEGREYDLRFAAKSRTYLLEQVINRLKSVPTT